MPVLNQPVPASVPAFDACPSFEGGQFSSKQSKLIDLNQASFLHNMDISKFGTATTRRGTNQLGGAPVSAGHTIQGLQWFNTSSLSLMIACVNGGLQKWDNSSWTVLAGYTPTNSTVRVEMAQGINDLFVTDGVGHLFQWDGNNWTDIGAASGVASVSRKRVSNVSTIVTASDPARTVGSFADISGMTDTTFNVTGAVALTGSDATHLVFNNTGTDVPLGSDSGATISRGNYTAPVCAGLMWHTKRLFAYGISTVPDQISVSNLLDGATWNAALQSFRVGGGDGDPIVNCTPWIDFFFVCLKNNSVWVVNADPTVTPANWTVSPVHTEVGCVARRSACQVGGDIWFLARDGVRSVRRIETQDQNEVSDPISKPIQDIMERINWSAASNACATFWNNRYILSIPVDSSTTNNYTVVYNTLTQSWAGYWTGWTPTIFDKSVFTSQDKRLLFGQTDGRVSQWRDFVTEDNEVPSDFQDDGVDIPSDVITRSLVFNEPFNPKKGIHFEKEFNKSTANITVSIIPDQGSSIPLWTGSTTGPSVSLPVNLPFNLVGAGTFKKALDLLNQDPFRQIQFQISSTSGKLSLQSIIASAFVDTIVMES